MEISFSIAAEEYDTLVKHAPDASPAVRALSAAAILSYLDGDGITQAYELTCDDIEAYALLSLAQTHCPAALRKIIGAIRQRHLSEIAERQAL